MINNLFKVTASERNRIQTLHENVKDKPQLDGSLNYPNLLFERACTGDTKCWDKDGKQVAGRTCTGDTKCWDTKSKVPPTETSDGPFDPNDPDGQHKYKERGAQIKRKKGKRIEEKKAPCKNIAKCRYPYTWDPNVCDCVCNQGQKGCKPGYSWSQADCGCVRSGSGTSGRGCCCNCKTGTVYSRGKDCPDVDYIKATTGPCDGKGCAEACKDYTPNTYSESKLKRIIKRTINESQLLLEKPCGGMCGAGTVCMGSRTGGKACCCAHGDWHCCEKGKTDSASLEFDDGVGTGDVPMIDKGGRESLMERETVCGTFGGSSDQCNQCCDNYVGVGGGTGWECGDCCDSTSPQDGCSGSDKFAGFGREEMSYRREMGEGKHSPYGEKKDHWGSNKDEYRRYMKGGVKHRAGIKGGKKYGKGGHYKTYMKDVKEQVYELPAKFGRKRMTESQLVRMIKHIIKKK